ncbi:MAG TPA: hypothetical protein VFD08_00095 [Clostridia bacterium]|nr:hypothetical protein [Clostridia bacterium]
MDKYIKLRKIILRLAIALLMIDLLLTFIQSEYPSSLFYIILFAHAASHLVTQYTRYKAKDESFSKLVFVLYIIFTGFSLYNIVANAIKFISHL